MRQNINSQQFRLTCTVGLKANTTQIRVKTTSSNTLVYVMSLQTDFIRLMFRNSALVVICLHVVALFFFLLGLGLGIRWLGKRADKTRVTRLNKTK